MTRLILVRHGETEWNRIGRYQGQSDTELSATGVEQAKRVAKHLASENIDGIYCSDLKRAMQTAAPIVAVHDAPVTYRRELRELDFGEFEGEYFEDIESLYLPLQKEWRAGNLSVPAPGGESLAHLGDRVVGFADSLKDRHDHGTLLIVGHGGPLSMMICHLLGIEIRHWWGFRLDSASISIVDIYPEITVLSLMNSTYYLKEEER